MRPLRLLVLAVVGLLGAFGSYAALDHRRAIREAETTTAQMLDVTSEHAPKVFETQDLLMKEADLLVRGLFWEEIGASEIVHRELEAAVGDLSRYASVSLIDSTGRLRNGSVVCPYGPDVNGARLADEARRRRPDLKVPFTTGYTRNAAVHNGVVDPGAQLLGKPFTMDQLAGKVRDVLVAPGPALRADGARA